MPSSKCGVPHDPSDFCEIGRIGGRRDEILEAGVWEAELLKCTGGRGNVEEENNEG